MDITKLIQEAAFNVSMEESNHKALHEQFDSRTKAFVEIVDKTLQEVNAKVWDTKIVKGFFGKKLKHELTKCYCKELRTKITDTDSVEYKIPINKEKCFILAFRKSDCRMVLYYAIYANQLNSERTCEHIGEFNSCEQFLKIMLPDILRNRQ